MIGALRKMLGVPNVLSQLTQEDREKPELCIKNQQPGAAHFFLVLTRTIKKYYLITFITNHHNHEKLHNEVSFIIFYDVASPFIIVYFTNFCFKSWTNSSASYIPLLKFGNN